jgi:hypothetical protein
MAIKLGSRVKDAITGYSGIVVGRVEYLYGCAQVCVVAESLAADGKRRDAEYIDEQRVIVLNEDVFTTEPLNSQSSATSGGPQITPTGIR